MNDRLKNIFTQSDCPDKQLLFDYLAGKLDPSKEHAVEEHLVDCAFCSEAIEAYREEGELTEISNQLSDIEGRILRGETGKKTVGFSSQEYFKYAALLALVLLSMTGLYFLLSENKDKNLVMEAPVSKRAPTMQKSEDRLNRAPEPAKAVKQDGRSVKTKDQISENLPQRELSDKSDADMQLDFREELSAESFTKVSNENYKTTPATVNQSARPASDKTKDLENIKGSRVAINTKEIQAADAITEFPESTVSDEVTLSNTKIAAIDQKKSRQILDSAIMAYDNRYYIQAINILLNFSAGDKKEAQKADWYLASSYVQTREYEKARPILERLISEGSSYSRKARKLLETF